MEQIEYAVSPSPKHTYFSILMYLVIFFFFRAWVLSVILVILHIKVYSAFPPSSPPLNMVS